MKIAIVHDYLFQYGGAEKVVEKWLEMYPEADVYTSFYTPEKFTTSPIFLKATKNNQIHTTWLQWLFSKPIFLRFFKHLFWIYPMVMSQVFVKNYDAVLISSTYCAKNVRYQNCEKIIHYCHSPTRFLHGLVTEVDHKSLNRLYRILIPLFTFWLKWMDLRAVDYLNRQGCIWIGNSRFIKQMIAKAYKIDAGVIYPPTEIQNFLTITRQPDTQAPFYLCHGRISFHKRIDLAIEACMQLKRKLVIGGTAGFQKEMDDLQNLVKKYEDQDPSLKGLVTFLGRTTDEQYYDLLSKCQAFVFPGREDAGIAPIEALAAGAPVVAYQAGGALEYIHDNLNGVFFSTQTVESLKKALLRLESSTWNPKTIKETSLPFDEKTFRENFKKLVEGN